MGPSIKTLVIQICKQFNKHNLEDSLGVNLEDKVDSLEDNLGVQTISIQIFLLVAQAILIIPTVLLEDNLEVQTISIQIVPLVVLTILIIPTVLLEAQIISDLVKP